VPPKAVATSVRHCSHSLVIGAAELGPDERLHRGQDWCESSPDIINFGPQNKRIGQQARASGALQRGNFLSDAIISHTLYRGKSLFFRNNSASIG